MDARPPEQVAAGFLAIAIEKMANAIKKISIQRGYDVSEYTLCCFGGAGGQHACQIANALGMTQIFLHPYAGVLSAYGMGLADVRSLHERAIAVDTGTLSTSAHPVTRRPQCAACGEEALCRPDRPPAPAGTSSPASPATVRDRADHGARRATAAARRSPPRRP